MMILQQPGRKDIRVTVYADALRYNVKQLRGCCRPGVKFCAAVKANAYGHGITNVIDILKPQVDFFAVISVHEALAAADRVGNRGLLVLEPLTPQIEPEIIEQCARKGIHCTILAEETVKYISQTLEKTPFSLPVHMNLDTGMGRCGVSRAESGRLWQAISQARHVTPTGIFTHFATSDQTDLTFAREQLTRFEDFLSRIPTSQRQELIIHAANSSAAMCLPESHFDMVRCGISIYGYTTMDSPSPISLRPALKLEAPINNIFKLEPGESASYGRTFVADRPTVAAAICFGYADGYRRDYSNRSSVKVNGRVAKVIGRVTMNLIVIDVTDVPDVRLGQWVTLIDNDYESPCGVYALARLGGTIANNVLTSVPGYADYRVVDSSTPP
jgi:alanine racemase